MAQKAELMIEASKNTRFWQGSLQAGERAAAGFKGLDNMNNSSYSVK